MVISYLLSNTVYHHPGLICCAECILKMKSIFLLLLLSWKHKALACLLLVFFFLIIWIYCAVLTRTLHGTVDVLKWPGILLLWRFQSCWCPLACPLFHCFQAQEDLCWQKGLHINRTGHHVVHRVFLWLGIVLINNIDMCFNCPLCCPKTPLDSCYEREQGSLHACHN